MIKEKKIDLTQGCIWQKLLLFFLPILAGSLLQQLYTTADAVIVGQFAGKAGLATIDSVYNLLKLPVHFFVGITTGATILISQYVGQKNNEELSKAIHNAIIFSFFGGLILSIAGVIFAPYFLTMLDVPMDIFHIALVYVRIYFAGLLFLLLYNIGTGILHAMGDSRTPLYYLIIARLIDIVLDFMFVYILRLGAPGAALGSVIAQIISALLVIRALTRMHSNGRLRLHNIQLHPVMIKAILIIGLPIGLQSSLYPIANMMIQANINSLGTDYIAAWALCGKLDFLIWLLCDSLAAAISTFAAQNFGAKQYDRVRQGVRIGLGMTLAAVTIISAVLYFWSDTLGKLFINAADYDVLPLTVQIMRLLSPLYFLYVFGEILSGAIRGTGETMKPMILTLLGTCLTRILWIQFIVPQDQSIDTIILSYPVSWLLTSASFIILYALFKRKKLPI